MPALLACPKCAEPWPASPAELAALAICPGCARAARALAFPALFRETAPVIAPSDHVLSEGEASCFYHPAKRATVPCGACGRFLCALCDVSLGDRHLCPGCVESGRAKGRLTELEPKRTLWDSAALTLAVLPLVLCGYLTVLTAPAALIVAWMGRKKPSSVVPRRPWRMPLAVILAALQIAAWLTLAVLFFSGAFD